MEKKDLKTGYTVEFRNGDRGKVMLNTTNGDIIAGNLENDIVCHYKPLLSISKDLTTRSKIKEFDIVKVYDINCFNVYGASILNVGPLLWERPENIELIKGDWYKDTTTLEGKYFVHYSGKRFSNYGFDTAGNWSEYIVFPTCHDKLLVKATEKEIKEKLINEATKRGFVSGAKYNPVIHNGLLNKCNISTVQEDYTYNHYLKLFHNGFQYLFANGVWAILVEDKVIPEYTMEQLQHKLGEEFKIKK